MDTRNIFITYTRGENLAEDFEKEWSESQKEDPREYCVLETKEVN